MGEILMKKSCQIRTGISILAIFIVMFLILIPNFVQGDESTSVAGNFRVTTGRYWETEDLDQCIINEFGLGYKIADWNDVLFYKDNIEEWANDLGMDSYIVRRNGEDFYSGSNRHYFMERFDHNKPSGWWAHDNIDNHFISLGSWYNIYKPILAIAVDPISQIDNLKEVVQSSQDEFWRETAQSRKDVIRGKLTILQELILEENFEDAYDKLLHDIKPKLTGLKTDENKESWGNGIFKNPWVTDGDLQDEFCEKCNTILSQIHNNF